MTCGVLYVLDTSVVSFVLHDCLDWQGHHPSHRVPVDQSNNINHFPENPAISRQEIRTLF